MVVVDPLFTLLSLVATMPLVFATHRSRTQLRLAARRPRKADGELASAATESLAAMQMVQAFTLEAERRRFTELTDDSSPPASRRSGSRHDSARWSTWPEPVSTAVGAVVRRPSCARRRSEPRRAAGVPQLPRLAVQADQGADEAVAAW